MLKFAVFPPFLKNRKLIGVEIVINPFRLYHVARCKTTSFPHPLTYSSFPVPLPYEQEMIQWKQWLKQPKLQLYDTQVTRCNLNS